MGNDKEKSATEDLQEQILQAATQAILSTMTPAMLKRCAQEILGNVLSKLHESGEYTGLGRMVKDAAEKAMREHLETDNGKAQIRAAVISGVNQAMERMPEEIKGKIIDVSLRSMTDALGGKKNSRY